MGRAPMRAGNPAGAAPSRGRAVAVLSGVALLAGLLLIGVGFAVSQLFDDAPPSATGGPRGGDGVDPAVREEQELVTRPMLMLPAQASLPHVLAETSAGPALVLPVPGAMAGRLVPGGFPATPQGALAQLVALSRAGVTGGDPEVYDAAYASVSEPGAPPASSSYVHQQLLDLRSGGGLRRTGPVPDLRITWTPTSGLIKGSASGGSLVVVCALGQLDVDYQGQVVSAGLGDCQAMRRVGGASGEWRIAAGPGAAIAPSAWPGSDEAVAAGYRELR